MKESREGDRCLKQNLNRFESRSLLTIMEIRLITTGSNELAKVAPRP